MSFKATKWAWNQNLKSSQKLVLLALADRADNNNFCYPSIKKLGKDTGLNRRTIINATKEISKIGLMRVKRKGFGKVNNYYLSVKNDTSVKKDIQEVPKMIPEPVSKIPHKPINKPIIESIKVKNQYKFDISNFKFNGVSEETIIQLYEHRKNIINKPIKTNKQMEFLIISIIEYANHWHISKKQALDFYLSNNWIGIDKSYKYTFRDEKSTKSFTDIAIDSQKQLLKELEIKNEPQKLC